MSKPTIEMRRSDIHGNGVFAIADIKAGDEIIEYAGRRLTHARADHKYGGTADTGHTFLFTLNDDYVIDGNDGGDESRWINHSCDPNCRAWRIEAEDGNPKHDRVVIEAKVDIEKGTELTNDYGIVLAEPYTKALKAAWACHCGTKHCSGTLLKPKPRKKK